MKKELLKQYAQLVAGVGINVQKGQTVVVRCPVDCADFGRALCAACFELGAKDVVMEWRDDVCSREHWLHADDSVFDAMYPWDIEKNVQLGRKARASFPFRRATRRICAGYRRTGSAAGKRRRGATRRNSIAR